MQSLLKPFLRRGAALFVPAAFALALSFSACDLINDIDRKKMAPYTPDFATEIIDADMKLGDMVAQKVEDGTLDTMPGKDNYYYFYANTHKYSNTLEEAMNLPPSQPATIDFAIPAAATAVKQTLSQAFTFSLGDQASVAKRKLTFMVLKSGTATVNITAVNIGTPVKAKVTFIGIVDSVGNPLVYNFTLNSSDQQTQNVPVAGYRITFDNTLSTNNTVKVLLDVDPYQGGSFLAGGKISTVVNITNFHIKYVEGYLGGFNLSKDFADTISLKFFNNSFSADDQLYFADPVLRASCSSTVGVPLVINIDNVNSYNHAGHKESLAINANVPAADNPLSQAVPAATKNSGNNAMPSLVTQSKVSSQLDKNNSNITAVAGAAGGVLSKAPNRIGYNLRVSADSNHGTLNNWGFDTSRVVFSGDLTVPLNGNSASFTLQDTVNINLPAYDHNAEVDSVTMRIYAKNGLPINCRANVIFMTDKLVHIDSLVHPKTPIDPSPIIIRPAPVESNGKVDSSKAAISTYSFTLSKTQFRALLDRQATKALFRANLTTTNAPATNVVIYPEYRLKVKVGLRIKTRIKI